MREFSSKRRFGIEIETDGTICKNTIFNCIKLHSQHGCKVTKYQLSDSGPSWHVKDDSTCGLPGKKGVEIASFVGQGLNDINHISNLGKHLKDVGCQVSNKCGLHIHAEAVDLSVKNVSTILAYWIKIQKVISFALPLRRVNNIYCKNYTVSSKFRDFGRCISETVWRCYSPNNLSLFSNSDRRVNLNLTNYCRSLKHETDNRKTLELRWPEGTLDPQDIKYWTILYLNFIDICKTQYVPRNLDDLTLKESLFYLGIDDKNSLDVNLKATRSWFLKRITKYGARRKIHKNNICIKELKTY